MYRHQVTRAARATIAAVFNVVTFSTSILLVPAATALTLLSIPTSASAVQICSSAAADSDGDGWGWENHNSCVVQGAAPAGSNPVVSSAAGASSSDPVCSAGVADDNGDGWGWENSRSCVIASGQPAEVSQSANQSGNQVGGQSVNGGQPANGSPPVCLSAASDDNNDGWGFENGVSCVVTSQSGTASSATSVVTPGAAPPPVAAAVPGYSNGNPICLTDASDSGNNGFGYENDRTCVVKPGVTATRSQPLLNQRSCIPWLEIGYGNYRLQNNTWNSSAIYNNNWSQCIELTGGPGNYVARWDYNWRPRNEGNDFAVKSYPQVYYGRKTRYNMSGTVAETGLPVRTDRMPQFWVDYDYSETGTVERNVAFESFFHTSCDAEEYNKQFEMMVWVGKPAIRTPGTQVTTVTLSGEEWDVYVNPALGWAYVAFVARQPSTSGTLNWNDFVYWSRDVGPSFGVPRMDRNACMGAIELGTETFWGSGTFTLNRFRVSRGG